MISGLCQGRLSLLSSLETAAGYNWVFADSGGRMLQKQSKSTEPWEVKPFLQDYTINYIPLYSNISLQARFFTYLVIFTGCGKFSVICRLSGLLTSTGKAHHQAHWSAPLWKIRYSWALCDLLLIFNDHSTPTAAAGFAQHRKVSEGFLFFM